MIQDYWVTQELLVTRYQGDVTGEALIDSSLAKSGDARLDNIQFIVGDWRDTRAISLTPDDVEALVACLSPISRICPEAKACTIVKPDSTGNALAAYYRMLCDELSWDVEVVHSMEEAYEWFGLPYTSPY